MADRLTIHEHTQLKCNVTHPLFICGDTGEREGQFLFTGGSSSSSSSDELSRVRSITSTFLLLLPFVWELDFCSGADG